MGFLFSSVERLTVLIYSNKVYSEISLFCYVTFLIEMFKASVTLNKIVFYIGGESVNMK